MSTERAATATATGRCEASGSSSKPGEAELLVLLGHELRGRLHALSGALEVMESVPAGSATDLEARAVASRQAGQLAQLVDELLDAGRVLTGRVPLVRHPLDLCALAQRLVASGVAGASCELQARTAWVDADLMRLEQVIARLLVSAALQFESLRVLVWVEGREGVLRIEPRGGLFSSDTSRQLDLSLASRLLRMHGGELALAPEGWRLSLPTAEPPRT